MEPLQKFDFITVPRIKVGCGALTELGALTEQLRIKQPIIITDNGIVAAGLLTAGLDSLERSGISAWVFDQVMADPTDTIVGAATKAALEADCDGVIGLGGGSSMDVAKLVAALMPGRQKLSAMYGVNQVIGERLPLVQIPTTAGTGSEATNVAIVTTGESTKAGIVSRQLYADQIILDPELTIGLPPQVTAATGIDAMVHAIEAFTSKRLKNPMSDALALQALRLLSSNISAAVKQGDNMAARSNMLYGAMLAGKAFSNAPVGAVHALAYPLGGIHHIPHGLSNSLVLPDVLRFNGPSAERLYHHIAQSIHGIERVSAASEAASVLADYFFNLAGELGITTRLRELSIPEDALDELARQAMLQQRLLINNPREVSYDDALAIYQSAY